MAEVENERYIRLIQLLYYGGLFITKHMITSKLAETGESFDTVLKKFKIQLDREFGKNKHQHGKIFPASGRANIEEWDIQLLTKVLLIVFHDKLSKEQRSHLSQLIRVRNDIMHGSALDKESYDRIKDDTIDSLRTLSSFYDTSIQQACNEHINKSLQGLPDAQKVNQTLAYFHDKLEMTLKKVEDVVQYVDETKKAIPAMEERMVDGICHKIQELENTLIEKLETLRAEKELRVLMQTELFVEAQNQELTSHIEKKIEELLENVDSVCQEVQMSDSYQDIRNAAKELLDLFKQLKDVIYKGCKRRCIELFFECTSCEGLQNLLRLFHSDVYQNVLTKLALAIKQNFQLICPVFITSQIPQTTLLKTAQELDIDCSPAGNSKQPPGNIDLLLSPEQNTELATNGKKETVLPSSTRCNLARGIQLDMECLSVEGILNVFELLKGGEISTKLQKLQDAFTKHYGQPIKMMALVNIQELINLLTKEDETAHEFQAGRLMHFSSADRVEQIRDVDEEQCNITDETDRDEFQAGCPLHLSSVDRIKHILEVNAEQSYITDETDHDDFHAEQIKHLQSVDGVKDIRDANEATSYITGETDNDEVQAESPTPFPSVRQIRDPTSIQSLSRQARPLGEMETGFVFLEIQEARVPVKQDSNDGEVRLPLNKYKNEDTLDKIRDKAKLGFDKVHEQLLRRVKARECKASKERPKTKVVKKSAIESTNTSLGSMEREDKEFVIYERKETVVDRKHGRLSKGNIGRPLPEIPITPKKRVSIDRERNRTYDDKIDLGEHHDTAMDPYDYTDDVKVLIEVCEHGYLHTEPQILKLESYDSKTETLKKLPDYKVGRQNQTKEDFYEYTVEELTELFKICGLHKMATLCCEEKLDGAFFKNFNLESLQDGPFFQSKMEVLKMKKIIDDGWRPKLK